MKKVIIIGAGFAGLSALKALLKSAKPIEIALIDSRKSSDFLPMLPDCIGRGISPQFLSYEIERFAEKKRFEFINKEVTSVNLDRKEVSAGDKPICYDYLIIAAGSETTFYGNEQISRAAFKLDSALDAQKIRDALDGRDFASYLVCGGGYTGIETATNLRRYLNKKEKNKKIIIVERTPSILGPLPQWMKDYVSANLKRLNIEVLAQASIEKTEQDKIYLSGGSVFEDAMLIWAAGVRAPVFIQNLQVEKNQQGRIKVDEYLRVNNNCFAAGDAANFSFGGGSLRMAVQFAIMQGRRAAQNIIRGICGQKPRAFRPVDLGYIIPMANNYSCGRVLGVNLKGRPATLLHYLMCAYRSYGPKNRSGVISGLIKA